MRWIHFFLFLSTSFAWGQTTLSKKSHDFGELFSYSDRFVDLKIHNPTSKKAFLLSVKKPNEVVYIHTGSEMFPDSTVVVRLQVNPKEKGKFSYIVEVYTSDHMEPFLVKLTGNYKEEPRGNVASFQACPSFGQRAPGTDPTAFELTVVVIDKNTRQPLPKSSVTLIQNGRAQETFKTDKNGKIVESVPLGYTYFYTTSGQYEPVEKGEYVNFQRNYILVEMERRPEVEIPEPELIAETKTEPEMDTIVDIQIDLSERLDKETPSMAVPPELSSLDPNDFSTEHFRPVNVSFVLDISSSMKSGDKIELMKFSLNELATFLRPEDRISLVTYADNARVLLGSTSGQETDIIIEKVNELRASGLTAGGEGIKLGYKENLKGYLPDGINHVIVITDGAFNRNSKDYKKYVKKYKKKGMTLSIVGIKNSDKDAIEMADAATLGGGRYIPIFKLVDAQNNLKQELRILSYRR